MKKIKLGELFKIKQGYAFKSKKYVHKSLYALCTLANISENNTFQYRPHKTSYYGADFPAEFLLQENDLIMPLTEQVIGLLGNTALVPQVGNIQFLLNQRVGKIIPDEKKADKYFLHYLLTTQLVKRQLEFRASGTKQRNISPDDVYDVTVYLPSIEKQQFIGKVLYSIEKKIDLNNKINKFLEKMAQDLYNYWFVQFNFPDENKRPYKSSGGKMVYNEVLKREIPVEWKVKAVKDLFKTYLGGTPSRNIYRYWNDGNISWLNSGEIANFPIVTSAERITQEGVENSATYLLPKNTVMISITGNIRVSISAINACTNQSVVGIIRNSDFSNSYLYFYFKNYIPQFEALMTGAVQKHINKDIIDMTPFLLPKESILYSYQQQIDPIVEKIINNGLENKALQQLRDFLLPMLMNGQISIKG